MPGLDTLMYVGEIPWAGLGHAYEKQPTTTKEIITQCGMDWTCGSAQMSTALHGDIRGWHAIYREDNNEVLGVVNRYKPEIVQNIDTFNAFEDLLGNTITIDTTACLDGGSKVFGCFKLNDKIKVLDDEVEHYFVVINEHLKPDGKVTLLHTPIRVCCQNMLSQAISSAYAKTRVPITADSFMNVELAKKIIQGAEIADQQLKGRASKMVNKKVSRDYIETLLDELFPYMKSQGDESLHTAANEKTSILRETFLTECMGADNLSNYRGTQWQVYNALTDFSQHYYKNAEKAYDLKYRMNLLPGMGVDSPSSMVTKYLKIKDKIAA